MIELDPCPVCRRHVTADDVTCPFCGAPVSHPVRAPELQIVGRVSRAAVFATLTAFAAPVHAQPRLDSPPAQPTTAPKKGPGSVYGRLTQAPSTKGLQGAIVEIVNQKGAIIATTTTGAEGRYSVSGLPTGKHQVQVRYDTSTAVGQTSKPVVLGKRRAKVDLSIELLYRRQIPKPYGAPPARRRIV